MAYTQNGYCDFLSSSLDSLSRPLMASSRKLAVYLSSLALFVLCTLTGFFYYASLQHKLPLKAAYTVKGSGVGEVGALKSPTPANSTLGFGTIAVVSQKDPASLKDLFFAANISHINLSTPSQPPRGDSEVETVRLTLGFNSSRADALYHLGHINALEWFLDSGVETALIIEDSADWDVELRSSQIPAAAAAVRELSARYTGFASQIEDLPDLSSYWCIPDGSWHILSLGKCGSVSAGMPEILVPDPTVPKMADLQPDTRALLRQHSIPERHRIIHRVTSPHCSLGYAVTRSAAERLLDDLKPRGEHRDSRNAAPTGELCNGRNLKCLKIAPGLFSELEGDAQSTETEQVGTEVQSSRKTKNIECSARKSITSIHPGSGDQGSPCKKSPVAKGNSFGKFLLQMSGQRIT
ncbi:Hypothetical predicted protein [Lecanosticta acicola]|uniref:Glycosyltransferase family 25 protein n=1 Tax=Lecanosticta acicola TaxID=111012 RepID=A0AAI8YT29_9PEZI|nr:Hypothetical predicted protein [Lecanosticta acicola]